MTKDTLTVKTLKEVLGELTYAEMIKFATAVYDRTVDFDDPKTLADAFSEYANEPNERPE